MKNLQRAATPISEDVRPLGRLEYEVVDNVKLDVSLIPDVVRDELAAATLEFVRGILRQPGGREMLDSKRDELEAFKKRMAAKRAAMKGDQ